MSKMKYKGYWIEPINFNTASLYMFYPVGSKRPNEYLGRKALSVQDIKTYIDSYGDILGDTLSFGDGQKG